MSVIRVSWILACVIGMTMLALACIDMGLRTLDAPYGVVSLGFCGFAETCDNILGEWDASGKEWAWG